MRYAARLARREAFRQARRAGYRTSRTTRKVARIQRMAPWIGFAFVGMVLILLAIGAA
jgi:hypothetical protein